MLPCEHGRFGAHDIPCSDPQCDDSTWDHDCTASWCSGPTLTSNGLPLGDALGIARLVFRLGEVMRVTGHPDGKTAESDTTHTVMVALTCLAMAQHLGLPVDLGRLLAFALVHDLPEAYAGDVNTALPLSAEQRAAKDARERDALARIAAELPDVGAWIAAYERGDTIEAHIVHYVDKVMPKLAHALDGGAALARLGIALDQARESHRLQGAHLRARHPGLPAVTRLFDEAATHVESVAEGLARWAAKYAKRCAKAFRVGNDHLVWQLADGPCAGHWYVTDRTGHNLARTERERVDPFDDAVAAARRAGARGDVVPSSAEAWLGRWWR
ncbi:MAG: HD domain-containing protein [Myxococcales bacterium]|nr:HD domain-containing protein [Myxococcales bacterium]